MGKLLKILTNIEKLLISTQKSILNTDEVCDYTGLSKSTIYKLTHKALIPHYKQAKHLYFDRKEIDEWLKEGGLNYSPNNVDDALQMVRVMA